MTATVATATTVVPITVEALAAQSDVVAEVLVLRTHSAWDHGLIVTDVELSVQQWIKGAQTTNMPMVLRTPGGTVGNIGQVIPGVPSLHSGDRVVVFLTRADGRNHGHYYLTHLTASILPVVATSPVAPSGPTAPALVRPAPLGMITESTPRALTGFSRAGLTLDQLRLLLQRGSR
ncbi:MAG: hypothetical protein Q8Q09_13470 [Deltaproteobacteria bacterium]|nr:hypothetical protein [Deltaproteobacteria bacterium]